MAIRNDSASWAINWARTHSQAPKALLLLATCFVTGYAFYFLSLELQPGIRRADALVWLTIPDTLLGNTIDAGSKTSEIGLLDRLFPLSMAVGWVGLSMWIGRIAVSHVRNQFGVYGYLALCGLAGLSLLSTVTLLIGTMGWLSRTTMLIATTILCLISLKLAGRPARVSLKLVAIAEYGSSQIGVWLWRLVPVGVVALGVVYVLGGLMPPIEFDVLEYHLQGPKEFYQAGRISFVPHNVYLNMPLAAEMQSLAMMTMCGGDMGWWYGGLAGKSIIALISLLSACLVGSFIAQHFNRPAGWAAAGLLLAAPGNIHVASCGLIDGVLGAYLLASVICLNASLRSSKEQPSDFPRWSFLAMFFASSAAACKYTGLIMVVLPCLVCLALVLVRMRNKQVVLSTLVGSLVALSVTVGPWYVKNWVGTGNPVYPLANSVFGRGNLSDDQIARWNLAHQTPVNSEGSRYNVDSLQQASTQLLVKSSFLPVTLIPLALVGFGVALISIVELRRNSRQSTASIAFWIVRHPAFLAMCAWLWCVLVWYMFTHRIDRFWLPTVSLAALFAGMAVHWFNTNAFQSIAATSVLLSLGYGGLMSLSNAYSDSRWFISYQSLRQDVGSEEFPGRLPATIGWINQNLDMKAKILLIGQAQAYRFERSILYATCFNSPPGEDPLSRGTVEEQIGWLKEHRITHVLIQWTEIDRYRSVGNYGFSTWPTRQAIDRLIANRIVEPMGPAWPFDSRQSELLRVAVDLGGQKP